MRHRWLIISCFALVFLLCTQTVFCQRFLSDYDSTLFIRDTVRPLVHRFENLHFSGYIQPQFQVASQKGAASFEGGNFADSSNNRFMLRRARIKVDYILPAKEKNYPNALFTFQFDITERGAFARDIFLRLYEPRSQKLALTMGLQARPFGYEVNLSSAYRESPERARISQTLMPAERDLGAMFSFESRKDRLHKPLFKFDLGAFNGPGLSAPADFDSYKDIISRFILKPYQLSKDFTIGAGISLLYGGWAQGTKYRLETGTVNGNKMFITDSSLSNSGAQTPRHYYGSDIQLSWNSKWGKTEIRAEYWRGTQPGTATTTVNPGALPLTPTYVREFDGAIFYYIQNIINEHWEVVLKYDWYDPNRNVSEQEIGKAGTNFTPADIKYSTAGFGINYYFNEYVKILAYYDLVRNEQTGLTGYNTDQKDNVFTLRMQLRF
jgi:hypothetical protein